ncbi:MAG: class I SAM-dependent methyltransferase [Solirubrobacterales bacterium]|nr:class I SAM-dependent methyltransferase [Solirubrobacterales bacterium]
MITTDALGSLEFSSPEEEWIEYGPPGERTRVPFHDYAAIYAVPGLYERAFYEGLGMCSARVVCELYANALRTLGRPAAGERVLDLGAGNGIGGQELRETVGVAEVVGADLEPAAERAAERDRPGIYAQYATADLGERPEVLDELGEVSAVVACSAIGAGHIGLDLLTAIVTRAVRPGGLLAFAVADGLVPDFLDELAPRVGGEQVVDAIDYVHRRQTDGTPHRARAVCWRVDPAG